MEIIDAQLHDVWPWSDWTGEDPDIRQRVAIELTIASLDALGIHGAVLFPGADQAAAARAAAVLPDRFGFVPHVSPDAPDVDGFVREARARPGLLGLRAIIGWPFDGSQARRLKAGDWDPVFAACERHEVPLFMFISGLLPQAADIAARFPGLQLIVDHLGLPQPPVEGAGDSPFKSLPQVLDLARLPNVNIKLCGLPALSREPYPYRDVAAPLRAMVDAFGAERLMWASDATRFAGRLSEDGRHVPMVVGPYAGKHTWAESMHFVRDNDVLTAAEKAAILGGTARRVLDWRKVA